MDTLWLLSGAADISGSLAKLIASAPRSARSPVLCFGKQRINNKYLKFSLVVCLH